MLSTTNGQTPDIPVKPFARARGKYTDDEGTEHVDDWRPPELPYRVGPDLRLPLEDVRRGGDSHSPAPTEDVCRAIEQMVINGSSVAAAKSLVGIRSNIWGEWTRHAKAGKQPFANFMARCQMARAHVEATCTTVIRSTAVHPDPDVAFRGAVKTLEQQFKPKYGNQKAAPTVQNTTNVQVNVQSLNALGSLDLSKLELLASALGVRPLSEPIAPTRALVEPDEDE